MKYSVTIAFDACFDGACTDADSVCDGLEKLLQNAASTPGVLDTLYVSAVSEFELVEVTEADECEHVVDWTVPPRPVSGAERAWEVTCAKCGAPAGFGVEAADLIWHR